MNPLVIVIPIVVILGAVVVFAALRRGDSGGATGALSRETKKRDRSEPTALADEAVLSGRQVEKSAAIERRSGSVEKVTSSVATYVPPDADAIGVTRRQLSLIHI